MNKWAAAAASAAAILVCSTHTALAWGLEGHRIVGAIADHHLEANPAIKKQITAILNGETLSAAAQWADCAKGICGRPLSQDERAYAKTNTKHDTFHYTNTPIEHDAYTHGGPGTTNYDVVEVLKDAIAVLQDKSPDAIAANLTKRQAVWVIAHLVGDVHQPLHSSDIFFDSTCKTQLDPSVAGKGLQNFGIGTIFFGTQGGNKLGIGRSSNFHSYWDSTTVNRVQSMHHLAGSEPATVTLLLNQPIAGWEVPGPVSGWPEQWAKESLGLAKEAFSRITLEDQLAHRDHKTCAMPITLGPKFDDWAADKAATQMAKAGRRLAALLEAALAD